MTGHHRGANTIVEGGARLRGHEGAKTREQRERNECDEQGRSAS
jgi:hypothetical protein